MDYDLKNTLAEHRAAVDCVQALEPKISAVATLLRDSLAGQGSIYICGNGGSAADAQHFAAELTGRFEKNRPGYPAVALTTDSSALTSIGNDFGFDQIFSRQLQALAQPGDVLLAISTSGNSKNVMVAVEYARSNGIKVVGLTGRDGGVILNMVDVALNIPVERTARVQEMHILILHMLCEAIEA
jgi:D-sedoheptulose 7-phosphate isomerase